MENNLFKCLRLYTSALAVGVLFAGAQSAYAQSAKVNLNVTNGKLNTVFNKIEKQTDYLFIYNNEVNTDIPANVSVKGEAVSSSTVSCAERASLTSSKARTSFSRQASRPPASRLPRK